MAESNKMKGMPVRFTYHRYIHRFGEAYMDGTLDIEGDLYYGL